MRIAVVADIHGNLCALEATLHNLNQQDIDQVVFNGDYINRGSHSLECLELLANYQHPKAEVSFILGNHDALILDWHHRKDYLSQWFEDPLFELCDVVSSELKKQHFDWIEGLQFQKTFGQHSLRISHGSPRHFREGFDKSLSEQAMTEIESEFPEKTFVGSHTHQPFEARTEKSTFINTSAVGSPFNGDPRAQFLLGQASGESFEYQIQYVPYDRNRARKIFKESKAYNDTKIVGEIFYRELCSARSILTPFQRWTTEQNQEANLENLEAFKEILPKRFIEIE